MTIAGWRAWEPLRLADHTAPARPCVQGSIAELGQALGLSALPASAPRPAPAPVAGGLRDACCAPGRRHSRYRCPRTTPSAPRRSPNRRAARSRRPASGRGSARQSRHLVRRPGAGMSPPQREGARRRRRRQVAVAVGGRSGPPGCSASSVASRSSTSRSGARSWASKTGPRTAPRSPPRRGRSADSARPPARAPDAASTCRPAAHNPAGAPRAAQNRAENRVAAQLVMVHNVLVAQAIPNTLWPTRVASCTTRSAARASEKHPANRSTAPGRSPPAGAPA